MYTNGYDTEGLFTKPVVERRNELDRYCKLEGMDYQHIISETHKVKGILNRLLHVVTLAGVIGH